MSRKASQQPLRFPDPPGLACAAGREEPSVWVRRIRLWHDISEEPARDIELKRGLNVVWSPPESGPDALTTGHAAGKTLLCRLLRYCLGEDSFADPEDTIAICAGFPNGAVGAEVRLHGRTWAVRRRFTTPRDDRAQRVESLDQISDENHVYGAFGSYVDEIERTVFDEAQKQILSRMEEGRDAWQYILAWLTRDQECRIDGLTHWRHPESSSHSPVRKASAESRLNVLRVALGLYSEDSNALRMEITQKTNQAENAKNATLRLQTRFVTLQEELATAFGVDAEHIWPPPQQLLQNEQSAREAHLESLLVLASNKIRAAGVLSSSPTYIQDETQLDQAEGELARVRQNIADFESEVVRRRERVKLLETESANRWRDVRQARHPECPYDGTPLDIERAQFMCPLPRLPNPAAASKVAEDTDEAREKEWLEIVRVQDSLASLRGEEASLTTRVSALRRTIDLHYLAADKATEASQTAWATKGMVRQLFELMAGVDAAAHAESQARIALKSLQDRQVATLTRYPTAHLDRWFNRLVQRVIASEARGTVSLDGNGLHPRIDWRGTRRSVALRSLQIVLFDLAAMLCAAEGHSPAPAFLVHDSPREGDLDPGTYSRIFEALFDLGLDDNSAPFQYILTTTTDPPEGVQSRVRLKLSAATPNGRLFQADL